MNSNITGIILAGGKSSRMGEDKSFIAISGKNLIEIAIDRLSPLCKELLIITNTPSPFQKYGIKIQSDIMQGRGPLGGIYTGLVTSEDEYNVVVACDMPFINRDLLRYMLGERDSYDAVIAERNNKLQPLCAVYSKNCIKQIEGELAKNKLKIRDFLRNVNVRVVAEKETERFDTDGLSFANINTREDYDRLSTYIGYRQV